MHCTTVSSLNGYTHRRTTCLMNTQLLVPAVSLEVLMVPRTESQKSLRMAKLPMTRVTRVTTTRLRGQTRWMREADPPQSRNCLEDDRSLTICGTSTKRHHLSNTTA